MTRLALAARPSDPDLPPDLERPDLDTLRLQARSPEAEQEDRDALLDALALPPPPGQRERAHADVLHRIIEDPWLGGFSDRDGRRVDAAAAQALVALGEPYASELSAAGQRALRAVAPPTPASTEGTGTQAPPPKNEPWWQTALGWVARVTAWVMVQALSC